MALPEFLRPRSSNTRGPDYSAKNDTRDAISGQKKLHSDAHYRPAKDDTRERCSECRHYEKPGQPQSSCAKVVGVIEAAGVCDLWQQRQESAQSGAPAQIIINLGQGR